MAVHFLNEIITTHLYMKLQIADRQIFYTVEFSRPAKCWLLRVTSPRALDKYILFPVCCQNHLNEVWFQLVLSTWPPCARKTELSPARQRGVLPAFHVGDKNLAFKKNESIWRNKVDNMEKSEIMLYVTIISTHFYFFKWLRLKLFLEICKLSLILRFLLWQFSVWKCFLYLWIVCY